ncbi:MAG: hypothetical protein IJZ85_07445 [Lachnospiraceae bacterium]|nr:hypothetical protein [Lachnospiraceae bacterium]
MGSKKKSKKKVIRYRRPFYFNIGLAIFLFLLIYLGIQVYQSHAGKDANVCEVAYGELMKDTTFNGIVWRDEEITTAATSGYVNYYLRDKKRTAVNDLVCTLDETGAMKDILDENQAVGISSLSDESLRELRAELYSFDGHFDLMSFSSIYEMKTDLDNTLLELINLNTMNELGSSVNTEGISYQKCYASSSGVIMYLTDGFEDLSEENVNAQTFDSSAYEKKMISAGSMVGQGSPIFKTVVSEDWAIFFPLSRDAQEEYGLKDDVVTVRFAKNGLTIKANYSTFYGNDGELYGRLDFNRYMIQFIGDRYLQFDIISSDISGLKIPVTAITEKELFAIPLSYLALGGNSSEEGFYLQTLVEGQARPSFKEAVVYWRDEEYCYVDTSSFAVGDYLVKPDSTETYLIRNKVSFPVVYNLNKGYAVFKMVEILAENEEYAIVSNNTAYGLNLHDRIAIDGDSVEDGEIFY